MSRQFLALVQMNDTHAYLTSHAELFWEGGRPVYREAGGLARIAGLVNAIRAETKGRVLFCDSGDTLHGTYPAVHSQGAALIPILNALGLAAMTGHWDFAYGPDVLRQRVAALNYPFLAANAHRKDDGKPAFAAAHVTEVGGARVGIIGLAANILDKTMPARFSEGLSFTIGREETPSLIAWLRETERVDLVVLLSHLGFPQDMQLVADVQGIDVVLSGHTHNRLYAAVRQGDALVIQSGSHGSFVTRLDLELDGGRIVDYRHRLLDVSADVTPDQRVDELVRQAVDPYAGELGEIVGETATGLHRGASLESTMDNLLLQALLASSGGRVAFSNGWRYGAPIPPGPVTLNDLYNMVPMNPPVSTVELRGDEMLQMLEENLEHTFARNPYDQMGGYLKRALGLTVLVKIENPRGQRVQAVFLGDEVLQPAATYEVAFVTEQGVAPKYGRSRQATGVKAVDALRAYLSRHRPARAETQGTFVMV